MYYEDFTGIGEPDRSNVYSYLDRGSYILKTKPWFSDNANFGLFSTCISEPSNRFTPPELQEGILTFSFIKGGSGKFFKVTSSSARSVSIRMVDGYATAYLYDKDIIFKDADDSQSMLFDLDSGINYIYIKTWNSNSITINVSLL